MRPIVELSQIDAPPLQRCSLAVAPGSLVAVLGPPGAGRSSLARVLAGHDRPERGRVVLDGVDVTESSPAVRSRFGLGVVHPRPRLFPTLTVVQNVVVALGAAAGTRDARRWRGAAQATARAHAVLERAGLAAVDARPAWQLEPEQAVRLSVAMSIAVPRRLLVVDELSALTGNPALTEELAGPICAVAQLGGAVVWFDSPGRLPVIPDRVVLLVAGRIVADGPPQDVESGAEWAEVLAADASDHLGERR